MIPVLVVVAALALTLAAVWMRRRAHRRVVQARWGLLADQYPATAVPPATEAYPLAYPPGGRVSAAPDGLFLAFPWHGRPTSVRVPWNKVRQVEAVSGGGLCVCVSHVGDLLLPARVGHDVWEAMNRAYRERAHDGGAVPRAGHVPTEQPAI